MYKKIKVLVIEDHEDLRYLTVHHLRSIGVVPFEADGVPSTLELLRSGLVPHLILLDLKLSGSRGEDLFGLIKAMLGCRDTKIVIMSAGGRLRDRAASLGADGWIQKPAGRAQIQSEVLRQLKEQVTAAL